MASGAGKQYGGSAIKCLTDTVRGEGIMALYRGFWPTYSRMAPWQMVFFTVYEQLSTAVHGQTI